MNNRAMKITGNVLAAALAVLFGMSAFLKLAQNETAVAQAASIGLDARTYLLIGVVELCSLVLFLIPRTMVLGSLFLIAYMGGAIATHLQHQQPIAMVVTVQIVLWITLVLRYPSILHPLVPVTKK
ncbi:MAG TPA: DoxX family protein [Flavipsychrobacter sp.]|nr:DoxX family protein [Flavipsychrobacter sp.]